MLSELSKHGYDPNKITHASINAGLFTNPRDINRAKQVIKLVLMRWNLKKQLNKLVFPSVKKEIIRDVEITISDIMASNSILYINSVLQDRPNQDLVKEAREAISYLKSLGALKEAEMNEYMLQRKIGEE